MSEETEPDLMSEQTEPDLMSEETEPDPMSKETGPVVLVVMGVSGSGKTTIAEALAAELGWAFEEGDDLHPPANRAKMAAGEPLTDTDRWPWLDRVAAWIADRLASGESGVITCSALRHRYRDKLAGDGVAFVFLHGSRALIVDRLSRRAGHFMPGSLLDSQIETLEVPAADEHTVSVELGGTPTEEADRAMRALRDAGIVEPG